MKTSIIYPGDPGPNTDPETEKEEIAPELPETERQHGIDASRLVFIALALMASTMLFAQNTPSTPPTPTPTPQTPTPMPHPTAQQPGTTQQPSTTHTNQGWTMFDNNVSTRLKLQGEQLQRLQEVDSHYKERYSGLGERPWLNSGYGPLTEQRNKDIQGILTPEQYKEWSATYGGATTLRQNVTAPISKP